MQAIHINSRDIEIETDATLLDAMLRMMAGVVDVAAVPSVGLVSVLYDERKTSAASILRAIRSVGFDARLLKPSAVCRRKPPLQEPSHATRRLQHSGD